MTKLVLKKVREIIENGWTQGSYARNQNGYSVAETSSDACCWCLSGALWKLDDSHDTSQARQLLEEGCQKNGFNGIATFNDYPQTTKQDVLNLIDSVMETL